MESRNLDFYFGGGVSVLVGTVDGEGNPACCRGVALTSADHGANVTVYVPVATSQETIANVAMTRRIAISSSYPIDHATVQLKGSASGVRLASDGEAAMVREQLEKFADTLDACGIPRRVSRRITCWPAFAIDVHVEERYEQTPGPKAGTPLS